MKYIPILAALSFATAEEKSFAVVNFNDCYKDSKLAQHEREGVEMLQTQMGSLIESTQKELKEISAKFEDSEYLDTLSPQAEEELRAKQDGLQERLQSYQEQLYQIMHQAHYQAIYKLRAAVSTAAQKIAHENGFQYVLNQESCFYVDPELNVTTLVITEMDREFDQEMASAQEAQDGQASLEQAE
ncbi:MAG: OmpH family outer membrane protein [Verrucomicrobiota bacterium]|nr:OmpH family outer membrane protein [Verrucomicrobiota bacterium]